MRKVLLYLSLLLITAEAFGQMTLQEYHTAVAEYSHALRSAEAAGEGAEAELRRARKEYLPSLTMSRDADFALRRRGEERRLSWAMRADITQPIFYGGSVRAAAKIAREEYVQALCEASSTALDVEYEAEVAYWSLSRAMIYHRAMSDYLTIVESLRDVVARRFEEGYTSRSDLLQVESRLSDAEYQVSVALQGWLVALHNFNVMRGADPATAVELAQSISDTISMPERRSLEYILATHPDYASTLSVREAACWGVRLRRADYLPSIGVGVYGTWQPAVPNVKGAGTRVDGGVRLTISTPIFHFMERREAVASARSLLRRAEIDVEDMEDRVSRDESNGWTNLGSTRRRLDAVSRSLDVARENLDISTYSYHEGLTTILDVLQAQLSWLQSYQNAIAAQYDYAVAVAAYRYIVGE